MRRIGLLIAIIFFGLCAYGQIPAGFVSVTATVPSLANGSFGAAWTNLSTSNQLALLGGRSTFQTTISGRFDSNGNFTTLVADNNQITPSPSTWTWNFTFACPAGTTVNGGFTVAIPITGGGTSLDISSSISAALPSNPCGQSTGAYVSLTKTALQTMAGPLDAPALNNIQKADQFPGATASEKINACLAAAATGTCDATGLTGTQAMDATVEIGAGGISQVLLLSPSTTYQPTVAAMTMFKIDRNGQLKGANINVPGALNFTGKVVDVEDTITNLNVQRFTIDDLSIDAGTYHAGGYGLYLAPPAGSWIQLTNFNNIKINGLAFDLYIFTTGANTYFNGNNFSNLQLTGDGTLLTMNADATSLQIAGNTFSNVQLDGLGSAVSFPGAGSVKGNIFSPIKIWDTTTPISNLDTGCSVSAGACSNIFIGSFDHTYTDSNASLSVFPNQNIYFLEGISIGPLNLTTPNIAGAPAWTGAHNSGTMGWNFTAAQGEVDYFQNVYTGGTYAHSFYAANNTNTGWNLLGGFDPGGIWHAAGGLYAGSGNPFSVDAAGNTAVLSLSNHVTLLLPSALTGYHGSTIAKIQFGDGTGTSGYVSTYDANGNVTDGKVTALAYHVKSSGVPTIACGTGAGTSPTVCSIAGNDEAGQISVTTGSAPASAAVIATVTLANTCPTTVYAVVRASNANAASLSGTSHEYPDTFTANTWTITANTNGLAATTAYTWAYIAKCN